MKTLTITPLFLLFLLFLGLKLGGVITWSWALITMPLWVVPALFLVMVLASLIVTVVLTSLSGGR